jgi:hypothetical protein
MSPGQLSEAFAEFPADLRAILTEGCTPAPQPAPPAVETRTHRLEQQVSSLTEALHTLARGLDNAQLAGFDATHAARAARLADEILLAAAHAGDAQPQPTVGGPV